MAGIYNLKYNSLLNTRTKEKWLKIGIQKRSGIAAPLFSLYSKNSIGIGEIPDLKFLIDWCKQCGFSIIQLLPLYDCGDNFVPYSPVSSFALDYMYISIYELRNVYLTPFVYDIKLLKQDFSANSQFVNYNIKKAKYNLLWKIFCSSTRNVSNSIKNFEINNKYWLEDYAIFKTLSELNNTANWEQWKDKEKIHDEKFLKSFSRQNKKKIQFYIWLQWQLSKQLKDVKKYAKENGILLMGDIPFLVSRHSADVWAHQNYFKLSLSAGAPPDMYFAYGQNWGMPPYDWNQIKNEKYIYLKEKLKAIESYYDLFRIDHFIGLFRIWTIGIESNPETGAISGKFDPENEDEWESHGKKLLDVILKSSKVLPCAEDLGTVPGCSFKALENYALPGTDFQRYMKKKP